MQCQKRLADVLDPKVPPSHSLQLADKSRMDYIRLVYSRTYSKYDLCDISFTWKSDHRRHMDSKRTLGGNSVVDKKG